LIKVSGLVRLVVQRTTRGNQPLDFNAKDHVRAGNLYDGRQKKSMFLREGPRPANPRNRRADRMSSSQRKKKKPRRRELRGLSMPNGKFKMENGE
jgi:hypothetical protein